LFPYVFVCHSAIATGVEELRINVA
jgi:hypothetical protein